MNCPKCKRPLSAYTETFYSCDFCGWMGMVTEEANKLRASATGIDAKARAEIALLTLVSITEHVVKKAELYNKKWTEAQNATDKALFEGAASATVQIFDYLKALTKDLEGYTK